MELCDHGIALALAREARPALFLAPSPFPAPGVSENITSVIVAFPVGQKLKLPTRFHNDVDDNDGDNDGNDDGDDNDDGDNDGDDDDDGARVEAEDISLGKDAVGKKMQLQSWLRLCSDDRRRCDRGEGGKESAGA